MSEYFYVYSKKARQSVVNYILTVFGSLFVIALLSIKPERDCLEYDCPDWMVYSGVVLGAVFAIGGVCNLIKNYEHGCALDILHQKIIWWDMFPARAKEDVCVSEIEKICVDKSYDNIRVFLFLKDGSKKMISDFILPFPIETWIDQLTAAFPELKIEIES